MINRRIVIILLILSFFFASSHTAFMDNATPSAGCVTVYEDINYSGKSTTFCGSTNYVGDFWNDRISSFKANCSMNAIKVYDNANFDENAESIRLEGGCRQINDLTIYQFNDRISSIKIE
ncbi:peptidase inhibitor family I36 protein [Shimazuella kribbensis]|uniref:peptidase inhibitor family I36 protein n=1 Tax=Shimazuella kribbensis TaxID=139808 RepID=UPI00048B9D6E|nr:peptidase inhibitor family I36 protein [Shimazuella kribbensis]